MFLKKGDCFCNKCFNHFKTEECIYIAASETSEGYNYAALTVKKRGVSSRVEARDPDDNPLPVLKSNIKDDNSGNMDYISVEIKSQVSSKSVRYVANSTKRVCPFCYNESGTIRYIPEFMGSYDSYLITMIGMGEVGKTCFVGANCSKSARDVLQTILRYPVISSANNDTEVSDSTIPNSFSYKGWILIKRKQHPVVVYFGDVAGETFRFNESTGDSTFLIRFKEMLRENSDALLLLHDGRDIPIMYEYLNELYFNSGRTLNVFSSVISPMLGSIAYKDTPVVCVLTKSDELQDFIVNSGGILFSDDKPVMTADSPVLLNSPPSTDTDDIALHMACANNIMQEIVKGAITIEDDTPCFIVSSGENNNGVINYTKSRNALMPLLYLLRNWL